MKSFYMIAGFMVSYFTISLLIAEEATEERPAKGAIIRFGDKHRSAGDSMSYVSFSPDGKILAVGGEDMSIKGKIFLWDWANRRIIREINHNSVAARLKWSPDGRKIAASSPMGVMVYDITTGNMIFKSRDSEAEELRLLHQKIREPKMIIPNIGVFDFDWLPDSNTLICACEFNNWDPRNKSTIHSGIAYFSIGQDWRKARIPNLIARKEDSDRIMRISLSPDAKFILTGDGTNGSHVSIWQSGTCKNILKIEDKNTNRQVAWSPDAKIYAASCVDAFRIWDSESKIIYRELPDIGGDFAWSPDSRLFVVAGRWVIDVVTGKVIRMYDREGSFKHVHSSISFNSNGRNIASGYNDGIIIIWDLYYAPQRFYDIKSFKEAWDNLLSPNNEVRVKSIEYIAGLDNGTLEESHLVGESLECLIKPAIDAEIEASIKNVASADLTQSVAAAEALESVGPGIIPLLKIAMDNEKIETAKLAYAGLIEKIRYSFPPVETTRHLLAIRALEWAAMIKSKKAQEFLEILAKGSNGAYTTESAKHALVYLGTPEKDRKEKIDGVDKSK